LGPVEGIDALSPRDALERLYSTDPEWVKTEYPNGVSEKLVIDSALQDQPK
jgi:hypothetical protein